MPPLGQATHAPLSQYWAVEQRRLLSVGLHFEQTLFCVVALCAQTKPSSQYSAASIPVDLHGWPRPPDCATQPASAAAAVTTAPKAATFLQGGTRTP
jgi:hypothetical protein